MRIIVTGGCGYVGSALVPNLLRVGHQVVVIDTMWFGCNLPEHKDLVVVKGDIRELDNDPIFAQFDFSAHALIHLAAVANDPCGELEPELTWEVNALATEFLAEWAARWKIPRFIYASSGSVYGVQPDDVEVTEDTRCVPLSEYNKTKLIAERVLMSHSDKFALQILRPATVCGYARRTRLDVCVNALTISALTTGKINVYGGAQIRPNIHITDMVRAYIHLLENPRLLGVYNAGFENLSVERIARKVQNAVGGHIVTHDILDHRSYRLNSDKLRATDFMDTRTVLSGIESIAQAFQEGLLKDEDNCYNLRSMPR